MATQRRLTDEQLRDLMETAHSGFPLFNGHIIADMCMEILQARRRDREDEADFEARQEEEAEAAKEWQTLKDFVRRAVRNARPRKPGDQIRWSAVSDAFALGSTSSIALCKQYGVDPHEYIEGPQCETCRENFEEERAAEVAAHDLTARLEVEPDNSAYPPVSRTIAEGVEKLCKITRALCDVLIEREDLGHRTEESCVVTQPGYYWKENGERLGIIADGEDKVRLI